MLKPSQSFLQNLQRNNSNDGVYTVFTGAKGMHNYGYIDQFIDSRKEEQKGSGYRKPCSVIQGTTGEMWPPYTITADQKLTFFVSHLCRSLSLSFKKHEIVKGIKVSAPGRSYQ